MRDRTANQGMRGAEIGWGGAGTMEFESARERRPDHVVGAPVAECDGSADGFSAARRRSGLVEPGYDSRRGGREGARQDSAPSRISASHAGRGVCVSRHLRSSTSSTSTAMLSRWAGE